MKREFLTDLGLEKDVIDKIMDQNGKDIESYKEQVKEFEQTKLDRDNYKEQLETAQEALKGFEGVDVEELNNKITTLNDELKNKETDYQAKLADMEFSRTIEKTIGGMKPRNSKAVMGLLNLDELKASKNQEADIKTALEAIKTENEFLFGSDEPIKNPVGGTNTPPTPDGEAAAMRAAAGLPPEK